MTPDFLLRPSSGPSSRARRSRIGGTAFGADDGIQAKCEVCRKDVAKYTCPSCELRYCSTLCFRSQAHSDCSEPFFKASVLAQASASGSVTEAQRGEVMDMIRRLEGLDADADDGEEVDDEDVERLRRRLDGVDLDSLPPEELLAALSPDQRRAFEELLNDPARAADLLQANEDDDRPMWWDADVDIDERRPSGPERPDLLSLPKLPDKVAEGVWNDLAAVLFAYTRSARYFSLVHLASPSQSDHDSASRAVGYVLSRCPFLTRPTTSTLASISAALDSPSASSSDDDDDRSEGCRLMLADADRLLASRKIVRVRGPDAGSEEEDGSPLAVRALSDLARAIAVARAGRTGREAKEWTHAERKVWFYVGMLAREPPPRPLLDEIRELDEELGRRRRQRDAEREMDSRREKDKAVTVEGQGEMKGVGPIEELA